MDFGKALLKLGEKTAKLSYERDGDYYGEDGLLYCGKCHTQKQVRVQPMKNMPEITQPCVCRCEADQMHEREEKRKREQRIGELRDRAFDYMNMQLWTFCRSDNEDPQLMEAMRRYVELLANKPVEEQLGLLISGGVGCGKTYAAACVVNALIDRQIPCKMTNFARIIAEYQDTHNKVEYMNMLNRNRLLVIDDLGAERTTSFVNEMVYQVIDSRARSGLPVIITTNLTLDEIKNPQQVENQRIYSRILEMCHPLKVEGRDRRRKTAADRYDVMKEYLGM